MSKLSVGIVGLPNVGKSTLFNALLRKQQAFVANFPFATIEPNVGIVPVPDKRLEKLAKIYNSPVVTATVEFVDIAGLIEGAHKGEGLGNKFLHHIREVDAICYVLRAFGDENVVREGSTNPKSDLEILKTELDLADYETQQKRERKKDKVTEELPIFKNKPVLIALNVDENNLKNAKELEESFAKEIEAKKEAVIAISAKLEEELASMSESDAKDYLADLGVENTSLTRLIKRAFETLNLITFLTAGEKEVRAWTIKKGIDAQSAAGVIHTDFEKNFIKADVADYNDFIELKGWKNCREKGKVRSEGRGYIVRDGDVIEFKVGNS